MPETGIGQAVEARFAFLADRVTLADLESRVACLETLIAKLMMLELRRSGTERDRSEAERRAS